MSNASVYRMDRVLRESVLRKRCELKELLTRAIVNDLDKGMSMHKSPMTFAYLTLLMTYDVFGDSYREGRVSVQLSNHCWLICEEWMQYW